MSHPGDAGPVRLGIVVVNYRSSALLERNLATLDRTALPGSVVVVVDSRSTAAERTAVRALARRHGWRTETPYANVGFGAGANLGVRAAIEAGCTAFLLLNPDVTIDAAAVGALLAAAEARPATVVSPRLTRPDGSLWFAGARLDRRTGLTRYRPDGPPDGADRWLSGACLLVTRACWDLAGGFDERYFLYWEDVEWSQRLLERGGDLLVLDDVTAVHAVGGTQRPDGMSTTYCRYMCRNRLRFAADHVPPGDRLRWLALAPRYARRILLSDGRAALLRRPSLVVAAGWGTAAGAGAVLRSLAADGAGRLAARLARLSGVGRLGARVRRRRPSSASGRPRSADRSPAGR